MSDKSSDAMPVKSISLDEWRAQSRWLAHRDKRPFSAVTGKALSWSEPKARAPHDVAATVGGRSIGVVVGDGLACIDLDKCLYPDLGTGKPVWKVKPRFKSIFDLAIKRGAYVEISQSGTGLHIFLLSDWIGSVKASFPLRIASITDGKPVDDPLSGGGVEVYGGRAPDGRATRFIAVTGNTKRSGDAQSISVCDELLRAALELASEAKAESDALKRGDLISSDSTNEKGTTIDGRGIEEETCDKIVSEESDEPDVASPVGPKMTPYFLLNKLAVMAAGEWFPKLFPGARKHGEVWRGRTPGSSRGDISLSPKGLRWWKSDEPVTPIDAVMQFAPDGELTAAGAVSWLVDQIGLDPFAMRGLATTVVRNSHRAPEDIFSDGTDEALPWVNGSLPDVLESYADCMAQELGVSQSAMALMFLIAIGASVPAGVRFQPDPAKPGWVVPATAWGILLAPSGASKSPVLDAAMNPLYGQHERWLKDHKVALRNAENKEEKDQLNKQGAKRRITNGSTTEALLKMMAGQPQGVILHADEVAGAFDAIGKYNKGAQGGHSDSAVFLQMYESRPFNLDRKDEDRSVAVERAHGSLIGGVQPAVLSGMAGSLTSNGMLQRSLIAVMTVSLYGDPCEDSYGREIYYAVVGHILRLGDFGDDELVVVGTPEVGRAMIEEGNRGRLMIMNDPTLSDVAKSILGKTTGHIARIALWLHMTEWALQNYQATEVLGCDPVGVPEFVGIECFARAARLWWGFCWPTLRHVYDGAGLGSSIVNDARNVGAYILGHEEKFGQPFTARVFRGVRAFEGPAGIGRLFAALDQLVERRWLTVVERQANGSPVYRVDERVWTLFGDKLRAA